MGKRRRSVVATVVILAWSLALVPLAAAAILTDPELSERLGISDQVTTTLTSTIRPALAEAVAIGDAVATTVRSTLNSALADAVSIGEQVVMTLTAVVRREGADSVGVTDQVTIVATGASRRSLLDSVGVADQVGLQVRFAFRPSFTDAVGVGDQVAIVRIAAADARLADLTIAVTGASLAPGTMTSLLASLDATRSSLAEGRTAAACGQLGAFAAKVQAQSGKAIPLSLADALLATTQNARRAIPCP